MNEHSVLYAETASDLRSDISKIGASLCAFIPLCSIIASIFVSTYTKLSGSSSQADFIASEFYYVYLLILSIVPIGVCIFLLSFLFKRKPALLMLKPTVSKKKFACITVSGLISIPIGSVVSSITAILMQNAGLKLSESTVPDSFLPALFFCVCHVILAPILEEFLFRGIILERLRRYSDIFAAFVSAFLFSLMHSSIQSIPFAFVCGLIFSFLAVYTGSPLSSMIVHFINNLLSVIMLFLIKYGFEKELSFIIIGIYGLILLSVIAVTIFSNNLFEPRLNKGILKASRKASIFFSSFSIILFMLMSIWLAISAVL